MNNYRYCIAALLVFALAIHPSQAQNNCPNGFQSITKIEGFDDNISDPYTQDGIKISNYEIKDNDPKEIIGGDWERIDGGKVARVQVKIGGGSTVTADANYSPPATSGIFSNSATNGSFNEPDPDLTAVSNIRFCEVICDAATLGEDQIDKQNGTLSNTISDDDGIDEFSFTTLDGFEVQTIDPDANYDATDSDGDGKLDTWTWTGSSGSQPTSVDFTLEATESTATYFLEVKNTCGTTVTFDPSYEFASEASRAQLAGNAPNPFSERTTVEFVLPEQKRVTVAVYDVMGRKVATLVDGMRSAGTHAVGWGGQSDSGQDLASGVYLLRMQAGDQASTRRLTIVR